MNRTHRLKFAIQLFGFILAVIFIKSVWANTNDPYETFNRSSFALNQKIDEWFLKPVATYYLKITPPPLVHGIRNFFDNLSEIPSTTNDVLQLNWYQGLSDGWRFFFNSTIGLGGLIDVSQHIGLPAHYTDFGLTLAKWGCYNSNYLVLPILGPKTVRDTLGVPVDEWVFTIYTFAPLYLRTSGYGLNAVEARAELLQYQNILNQISFDPYVFQRDAYLQKRNNQVEQTLHPKDWHEAANEFNQTRKPSLTNVFYYQSHSTPALF